MKKKRTYFAPTTAQQRDLLFTTWEETESVSKACAKAHVSRQTFYNWKSRFEEEGYEGLKELRSHAPKNPKRIEKEVEAQVIEMRQEYPTWGKQRIADELAKQNNWVAIVSPNTVKRILRDGGLWMPRQTLAKKSLVASADSRRSRANDQR